MERPSFAYKYHKINQYLIDLLRKGELWFSHQQDLNDPFDCKYAMSDDYLNALLEKSTSKVLKDLKKRLPELNGINEEKFLEIMLPSLKNDEGINFFYDMLFGKLGWNVSPRAND